MGSGASSGVAVAIEKATSVQLSAALDSLDVAERARLARVLSVSAESGEESVPAAPAVPADIRLVNVGWMRRQWDCAIGKPVPGSWLSVHIVGKLGLRTFPHCQELPPEASAHWSDVPQDRRVAVSHKWQTKAHPSPNGDQFNEILSRASFRDSYYMHGELRDGLHDDHYIFYDFLSLRQWPRDGGNPEDGGRWREVQWDAAGKIIPGSGSLEEEGFQRALAQLTDIFQCWTPFIVFTSEAEFKDYQDRSWCFFEIQQMLPKQSHTPRLHFRDIRVNLFIRTQCSQLPRVRWMQDGWNAFSKEEQLISVAEYFCNDLRRFVRDIISKNVTNGSDKVLLVRLYTEASLDKVAGILGQSKGAQVVSQMLQYTAATCALCTYDTSSAMSSWRALQPGGGDIIAAIAKPLDLSIALGCTSLAQELIASGMDCLSLDSEGNTLLHKVCQNGHSELVPALMSQRADPAQAEQDGWTPLMYASQNGHVHCLTELLDRRADPAQAKQDGWTPLMYAGRRSGRTALSYALAKGHSECADALVRAADAKVIAKGHSGRESAGGGSRACHVL